ncbi:MAG: paraquat-inducible protein A, partial [Balneola sp.]
DNTVIKFLVFKTAKWSMADVMVVAIFMAYIGFTGIISEQLSSLENIVLNVDIMTTNASSLQIGFFLFTSFAVLSLLVSHKLQYQEEDEE